VENSDGPTVQTQILLSKGLASWKKTIYVVGLPRSGKSTTYNVLASCKDVEALEEPFDLLSIAQKASQYSPDSVIYQQYQDLYLAMMENHFSELVLGRTYNFRKQDKSYVFNYKTSDHVELAHARARRKDVLTYAQSANTNFVIAFNDLEQSLNFVAAGIPNVQFVHIKRNVLDVALGIAKKEWLTDEQLSTQANLAPAYRLTMRSNGKLLYLPYLINETQAKLFVSLNNFERALMYAVLQNRALVNALSETQYPCLTIHFEEMLRQPHKKLNELIDRLNLIKTEVTTQNIDAIEKLRLSSGEPNVERPELSPTLKRFLSDFPEFEI